MTAAQLIRKLPFLLLHSKGETSVTAAIGKAKAVLSMVTLDMCPFAATKTMHI